jgi:hypothetical protein
MAETKTYKRRETIHPPINMSAVNKDSIEAITKETDRMVTGTFVNVECPGQTAMINCKYYKGQQVFKQLMFDNEKYTVPLSVARHINERCFYQQHKNVLDANGLNIKGDGPKIARYKFVVDGYLNN